MFLLEGLLKTNFCWRAALLKRIKWNEIRISDFAFEHIVSSPYAKNVLRCSNVCMWTGTYEFTCEIRNLKVCRNEPLRSQQYVNCGYCTRIWPDSFSFESLWRFACYYVVCYLNYVREITSYRFHINWYWDRLRYKKFFLLSARYFLKNVLSPNDQPSSFEVI